MADLFKENDEKVRREHEEQTVGAWDAVLMFLTASPLETTAAVSAMYDAASPRGLTAVELLEGLANIGAELRYETCACACVRRFPRYGSAPSKPR